MTNTNKDFGNVSKIDLVRSALVAINNLYEVLENCNSELESKKVSGCIYLLETSLYGESSQDPFVKI